MSTISKVLSGIGVLIAIFLFLNNMAATTSIINTIGKNSINGIAVLQGRDKAIIQ